MSPSARRLTSDVATARFAWQTETTPESSPAALFQTTSAPVATVAPAMRDLPSPSAERLQAIEREAFAKGFARGERAGEAAAAERNDALQRRLVATVDDIASLRSGLMRRAERELVRLAVAMAERILRREINVDRDLLVVMARVAIDRLGEHAVATVHLNPDDHELVIAQRDAGSGKAIELVADPHVPRGGCVVRSNFGTIDVGIDAQMRELARELLGDDPALDSQTDHGTVSAG